MFVESAYIQPLASITDFCENNILPIYKGHYGYFFSQSSLLFDFDLPDGYSFGSGSSDDCLHLDDKIIESFDFSYDGSLLYYILDKPSFDGAVNPLNDYMLSYDREIYTLTLYNSYTGVLEYVNYRCFYFDISNGSVTGTYSMSVFIAIDYMDSTLFGGPNLDDGLIFNLYNFGQSAFDSFSLISFIDFEIADFNLFDVLFGAGLFGFLGFLAVKFALGGWL